MVVVSAIVLGVLVLFGIGYVLSLVVFGKFEEMIERGRRIRTGVIPPLDQKTLDVNSLSIAGGVLAVVLVLSLLLAGPGKLHVVIWYILIGIGVIFGLLTFVIFRSESKSEVRTKHEPTASTKAPPGSIDGQEQQQGKYETLQNPQRSKESLYHNLLLITGSDKECADRLIEYERNRKPNASDAELISSAIESWVRDNK